MGRGLAARCPRCGQGKLFSGFLRQVDRCSVCGEPLQSYKVGLLLPFVVIMIVGSVIILVMLDMELNQRASPGFYLAALVPLAALLPIAIIRPAKGAIIGLFWSKGISDELER